MSLAKRRTGKVPVLLAVGPAMRAESATSANCQLPESPFIRSWPPEPSCVQHLPFSVMAGQAFSGAVILIGT
jgi:hypothetical protein